MDVEQTERLAIYRAQFLTWKYGRQIANPVIHGEHWLHLPLRWWDTGEPVQVAQ